jgi:hypothetical protein
MVEYQESKSGLERLGNFIFGLIKCAAAAGLVWAAIVSQRDDALQHLGHKNPAFLWGYGGLAFLFALWGIRSFVLAVRSTRTRYHSGSSPITDTQYTHLLLQEISNKNNRR